MALSKPSKLFSSGNFLLINSLASKVGPSSSSISAPNTYNKNRITKNNKQKSKINVPVFNKQKFVFMNGYEDIF